MMKRLFFASLCIGCTSSFAVLPTTHHSRRSAQCSPYSKGAASELGLSLKDDDDDEAIIAEDEDTLALPPVVIVAVVLVLLAQLGDISQYPMREFDIDTFLALKGMVDADSATNVVPGLANHSEQLVDALIGRP